MGAGRLRSRGDTRQPAQGRYAVNTSSHRPRVAGAPAPQEGDYALIPLRLRVGARSPSVKRVGAAAKLGIKVHAHMLRHACGFKLANDGIDTRSLQAYLGHSNIQNTTRYTALASGRFKNFWRD
jgi:integrase